MATHSSSRSDRFNHTSADAQAQRAGLSGPWPAEHPKTRVAVEAATACASRVLRLQADADTAGREPQSGLDIDTLAQTLRTTWSTHGCAGRRPVRVEVSCVESCAETRDEREQDARRLIDLESSAHRGGGLAQSLRATLVRLDPGDYLLLLAAPAAASAVALSALIDELSRSYRLSLA